MELSVMGENKKLFNEVSLYALISIICVVIANFDHFTNQGTNNEESVSVQRRYRIINDDNFLFHDTVLFASLDKIIEIQERKEMSLTITKPHGNTLFLIFSDYFIGIRSHITFFNFESFKARIT